jgi:hypothetical protein
VSHWLVGVEVNYNCGTTLYASGRDEKVGVYKEQGRGTIYGSKCGEGIHDPTHRCDSTNTNVSAWMVHNQHHLGVIYNLHAPFIKYASCTCRWALCKNSCKHQIVVFMTCTNLISSNNIEYCSTWYGTDHNGFKAMFANLANGPFSYDGVDNHETEGSSTPMEWTLCWLQDTMAEITHKCKESTSVQLCDCVTSHLQIVASKIWNLRVTHVSELMHPNMLFSWVEDGLGNIVSRLKYWHETMLKQANSHSKRSWE